MHQCHPALAYPCQELNGCGWETDFVVIDGFACIQPKQPVPCKFPGIGCQIQIFCTAILLTKFNRVQHKAVGALCCGCGGCVEVVGYVILQYAADVEHPFVRCAVKNRCFQLCNGVATAIFYHRHKLKVGLGVVGAA